MARKGSSHTAGFSGRTIGAMIKRSTGVGAAKAAHAPQVKKKK